MILEALKTKTAASHANVEASPLMAPISRRSITVPEYTHILEKFYGYFHPLEVCITNLPAISTILPDFSSRRKSSSILQDLSFLRGTTVHPESILLCSDLPKINSASEGLGALYVMEGSTLGGKFISRIIQETLGLTPENGINFFNGYGPQTGVMWKSFGETLTRYSTSGQTEDAVVAAADETFRKLEKWFTK